MEMVMHTNDEGPSNAAHWHKRATAAEARCAVLELKLEAARRELAKVNNEFGSENAEWPEAWRRVAEVKERAGRLWRDNETLRAALSEVLEVVSLPREPNWAYRNTITTNKDRIKAACRAGLGA